MKKTIFFIWFFCHSLGLFSQANTIKSGNINDCSCYDNVQNLTQGIAIKDGHTLTIPDGFIAKTPKIALFGTGSLVSTGTGVYIPGTNTLPCIAVAPNTDFTLVSPTPDIRIGWDFRTIRNIASAKSYFGRLKRLVNGELLLTYSGGEGHICLKRSKDEGLTWSTPQVIEPFNVPGYWGFMGANFIQLQNGNIVMVYTGQDAGPCVRISTDNGYTWTPRQQIDSPRAWECFPIQLPSGEIQVFYASEDWQNKDIVVPSGAQDLKLIRSFDGGLTWTSPKRICWGEGASRDGTPSALYLQNNKGIVVTMEMINSVIPSPSMVYSSVEDNWNYPQYAGPSSPRRYHGATEWLAWPYLIQLPTGEVIQSSHGDPTKKDTDFNANEMYVQIGNDEAKNFNRTTLPFRSFPNDRGTIVNGMAVLDSNTIMALGGTNGTPLAHGYVMRPFRLQKSTISVDGQSEAIWNTQKEWFVGTMSSTQARIKMLTDNANLYFSVKRLDDDLCAGDSLFISIDPQNLRSSTLQTGLYRVKISENILVFQSVVNGVWQNISNPVGIQKASTLMGTFGNDSDKDTQIMTEIAIPWTLIGGLPTAGKRLGINIELIEKKTNSTTIVDEIIGASEKIYSGDIPTNASTWLSAYMPIF